jgi:hypothetical protein
MTQPSDLKAPGKPPMRKKPGPQKPTPRPEQVLLRGKRSKSAY